MAYTTVDNPELYFQAKLYNGNGGTQSITLDGTENMQPDWVWCKGRNFADNHISFDSVRGATKVFKPNLDNAETTVAATLTSFDSDGFSLGSDGEINQNNKTFVAWNWKKTATAGFDIVSFTGNATARTISHSLSAVPKWYLVKNRSAGSTSWRTYHTSIGATKFMALEHDYAEASASSVFNNTEPTSSVFSVGTDTGANGNGNSLICYLFSEIKGYSKFGSYTGNANADAPFIFTGFRPAWFMFKDTESTTSWIIKDNKRLGYNGIVPHLQANTNDAENTDGWSEVDFLSNGIKLRNADNSMNKSGSKFIYMAFAESPFVNSKGVPNNAK